MLLASCANMSPASLPFVRIDPSLTGAVVSRDAAIAIAAKRADDRAKCAAEQIDCDARALMLKQALAEQSSVAQKNLWWGTYGGLLVLGGILTGLAAGFAAGFAVAK